jgi:hypothetical protein
MDFPGLIPLHLANSLEGCRKEDMAHISECSMSDLNFANDQNRVVYWGKIMGQNGDYLIAQGLGDSREDKKETAIIAGGDQTIADYFKSMKIIPKKTFRLGWVDSLPTTRLENARKSSKKQHGFDLYLKT